MESEAQKKALGEALDSTIADFKKVATDGKNKAPKQPKVPKKEDATKELQKDIKARLASPETAWFLGILWS